MSAWQCISACYLLWTMFWWQPFIHAVPNVVRVGAYTTVAYCAWIFVLIAHAPGVDRDDAGAVEQWRRSVTLVRFLSLGECALRRALGQG